ncbi:MAG: hypothetical protein KAW93_08540 [Methanogenium sp.]|nr:hypothetical protein [Methanogenium sp.]
MADFIQTSNTKTAVRDLAVQFADLAGFDTLVQSVINDNPFGCVGYITAGVSHDGVEKNREAYTAKIVYEDDDYKSVGHVSAKAPTVAGFDAAVIAVMADTALATAMGGEALRDQGHDTYSAQLKCCDPNGEIYYVSFSRDRLRLSSYSDDAIRTTVETWADGIPALA